ncbi:hypothetical protein D9M71_731650 [compost metagenome]
MVDDHHVANGQIVAWVVDFDLPLQFLATERFGVVDSVKPELSRSVVVALCCIKEHRAIAAHECPLGITQPVRQVLEKLFTGLLFCGAAQINHRTQAVQLKTHQRGAVLGLILLRQHPNRPQLLIQHTLCLGLEIVAWCVRQVQFRPYGAPVWPQSTKPIK